jgi:hypothetical protein
MRNRAKRNTLIREHRWGAKVGDKERKMNPKWFVWIYMKLVGVAMTYNLKQFLHDKKGDKNH